MSALATATSIVAERACSRCGTTGREVHDSARGVLCVSCYLAEAPTPIEPNYGHVGSTPPSQPKRLSGGADDSRGFSWDETAARARALGIDARLGCAFACVLAGHDHSARLHPTSKGYWQYRCDGAAAGYGLGEVRAFLAYGGVQRISNVEAARWHELLHHEAGLLDCEPVGIFVPEDASSAAKLIGAGIGLFLALRDPCWPQDEPFLFARKFARARCGVSDDVARRGIEDLERLGLIERVGKCGRAILWRLPQGQRTATPPGAQGGGDGAPSPRARLVDGGDADGDTFVAAVIETFDAEEMPATEPASPSAPSAAREGREPCPYAGHRARDWTPASGGPAVCGVCHPPAHPSLVEMDGAA
jgi:hypothetical protein